MTIRDMKIFLAVCEAQSMSAAAARLSISQSAVSQSIREIERHFGTKVFERVGNRVYLTDSGRNMASCSAHVVSYLSHMESLMRSSPQRSILHVGSFGPSLLVDLVKGYQQQAEHGAEIVLHVYSPSELLSMLSTGAVDAILTDSKPFLPGLVTHHIGTTTAAFICHPHSKLHPALEAEHPVLQLQDLDGMPMLLRDEGNNARIQFEKLMLANNINLFCKGMFTSYEGIFSAVDCDLGIGLTTDRIARVPSTRYKQITIPGAELCHEVYIAYLARKESTPYLADFVAYAREHVNEFYVALDPM